MDVNKKSRFIIYLVSSVAALSGLLFGFDSGIISGAVLFIKHDFMLTTGQQELIVSTVLLGAMVGSLCCGRLTDQYGRRRVMLLTSLLFIFGTIIETFSPFLWSMVLGRFLIGTAIGIGSYTAPLYIAEAAPFEMRGALVSLNQLAITVGIMITYAMDYFFTTFQGSWRWMFGIGFFPALLLCVGMFFLPESPRWLMRQGRKNRAKAVLSYLRGTRRVDQELNEIENSFKVRNASFFEIFSPWIRPVLFLGIMLGFLQQVTGINTIIYYAPTVFQIAGFHDISTSILATVGIGIVNVLATIFAILYLDKIGRRPLLLAGLLGMCLALLGLSYIFHGSLQATVLRWSAIGCILVYIICFAFSLGAILWLLISEIFPLEVRGAAMGISVFSCWFWNFVVSSTFLTLLASIGPGNAFLLFAVMCLLGLLFCYFKVPETKGMTLEQIEDNIRKGFPLREIGQSNLARSSQIETPELSG